MKDTNRYNDLADLINCGSTGEDFAVAVENLRQQSGVPASIAEYGIEEKAWNDAIASMAEHALQDPCTGFNPRKPTTEDLAKIYKSIFNGEKINF